MVEENFENFVCETPAIGINLPIQYFTVVDENSENYFGEMRHIAIH